MCIGIPMRVLEAGEGRAVAESRGQRETVDTRLVGDCARGDWLLVFQGAAREKISAGRAAEVEAALELLVAALAGDAEAAGADPGFALPSTMSAAQLAALSGLPAVPAPPAPAGTPGEPR